jgi:aryl-alcohol dehydrogenase-like predicted oxidoreductase
MSKDTELAAGDFRSTIPRFSPQARAANQALVDGLAAVAARKGATAAQIALAWVMAQKPWIVPIPGTTKLPRLEENLKAADIVLTAEDLTDIENRLGGIAVQGHRYPETAQSLIDR